MSKAEKMIKVTYSSTREKNIKDVIETLIKIHENCVVSKNKSEKLLLI